MHVKFDAVLILFTVVLSQSDYDYDIVFPLNKVSIYLHVSTLYLSLCLQIRLF